MRSLSLPPWMLPPDLKNASALRSPPLVVPRHHPRAHEQLPPLIGGSLPACLSAGLPTMKTCDDCVNEVSLRKIEEISLEYTLLLTASPKLGSGVPPAVMLMAKIFVIRLIS